VHAFIEMLDRARRVFPQKKGVVVIPIASQGAGKSWFAEQLSVQLRGRFATISSDEMRLRVYREEFPDASPDYRTLWETTKKASLFALMDQELCNNATPVVYIDKMNLVPKSRARFLSGSRIRVAVLFKMPIRLQLGRHFGRPDREWIGKDIVLRSRAGIVGPQAGEFDVVFTREEIGPGQARVGISWPGFAEEKVHESRESPSIA
jgi:hypothetical protein